MEFPPGSRNITRVRVGAVVARHNGALSGWLDRCEGALGAGAEGLFVPDHTRARDRFEEWHMSCSAALGAARARFGGVALGPLVGRVGGGMDEHVISMLDTISEGEVVAALGIGDRNARAEHAVSGIPWDEPMVRWERLCRAAERCVQRGWETYAATDRADLAALLPDGVGVHVQNAVGESFGGRALAWAGFGETPVEVLECVIQGPYRWVCVVQQRGESDAAFRARLSSVCAAVRG